MSETEQVFYVLPEDIAEYENPQDGYITCKIINENRVIFLYWVNFGLYQLCLASRLSLGIYDTVFQYKTEAQARKALEDWNDVKEEPDGWFRHPQSGRRRPNGDKTQEYIHW